MRIHLVLFTISALFLAQPSFGLEIYCNGTLGAPNDVVNFVVRDENGHETKGDIQTACADLEWSEVSTSVYTRARSNTGVTGTRLLDIERFQVVGKAGGVNCSEGCLAEIVRREDSRLLDLRILSVTRNGTLVQLDTFPRIPFGKLDPENRGQLTINSNIRSQIVFSHDLGGRTVNQKLHRWAPPSHVEFEIN